ncbi:hypothetical protein, partial [Mesorhizobium sp. M1A.F.Ca.IN.022.07.1.1]|uniref:hypothetical protein n=1 Tax=Mesorhizobium sp. M1A.F.Ca.IN.022.07.1.1 TaxID=2496767 RepID=UPI0019D221F8
PHPPAGTFSRIVNGEKRDDGVVGAHAETLAIGELSDESVLSPVTIRGEMPGRAMRGSANL